MGRYDQKISDLDVKIAIDSILLGWLSKVVGKSVHEVCFDLLDMSANVRMRLAKRNGQWSEDKAVKYPGLDLCLKVRAERTADYDEINREFAVWKQACIDATGVAPWNQGMHAWANQNPQPRNNPQIVLVKYDVSRANMVTFTQTELEHKMTEQFLLGVTSE